MTNQTITYFVAEPRYGRHLVFMRQMALNCAPIYTHISTHDTVEEAAAEAERLNAGVQK